MTEVASLAWLKFKAPILSESRIVWVKLKFLRVMLKIDVMLAMKA
jgi:hypothetical protein